jgi:hypothetical protein
MTAGSGDWSGDWSVAGVAEIRGGHGGVEPGDPCCRVAGLAVAWHFKTSRLPLLAITTLTVSCFPPYK